MENLPFVLFDIERHLIDLREDEKFVREQIHLIEKIEDKIEELLEVLCE